MNLPKTFLLFVFLTFLFLGMFLLFDYIVNPNQNDSNQSEQKQPNKPPDVPEQKQPNKPPDVPEQKQPNKPPDVPDQKQPSIPPNEIKLMHTDTHDNSSRLSMTEIDLTFDETIRPQKPHMTEIKSPVPNNPDYISVTINKITNMSTNWNLPVNTAQNFLSVWLQYKLQKLLHTSAPTAEPQIKSISFTSSEIITIDLNKLHKKRTQYVYFTDFWTTNKCFLNVFDAVFKNHFGSTKTVTSAHTLLFQLLINHIFKIHSSITENNHLLFTFDETSLDSLLLTEQTTVESYYPVAEKILKSPEKYTFQLNQDSYASFCKLLKTTKNYQNTMIQQYFVLNGHNMSQQERQQKIATDVGGGQYIDGELTFNGQKYVSGMDLAEQSVIYYLSCRKKHLDGVQHWTDTMNDDLHNYVCERKSSFEFKPSKHILIDWYVIDKELQQMPKNASYHDFQQLAQKMFQTENPLILSFIDPFYTGDFS